MWMLSHSVRPRSGPWHTDAVGTTTQWERHAFVLTDIESSTQRWEADSTAMAADLAHHDETITAAFVGAGGEQLKSLGDGFLYRFRTVESAARAAVEAQIALHSAVWPHAALHVRMGVHVGEAQVRDGDYFGPTVNRCARVTAAGSGGQILATREVVEDIATEPGLADRLHHHGACRLKDLGEPVEIWEILHAEQVGPVSPRALIEGRHNLPYHLSSFVGRRDDISELRSLVRDRRLVTLTGSGGVGKTRLALQVMALLADDFPDGTWLVSLDSVERPEQVAERALEALDLRAVSGEHPLRTLAREVNARRMLILFDSCEHVVEPVARTIDAIANDRLRLLTTSRRPLGIEGEMVWRVRSLRTDSQRRAGAQTAHLSEAVQLFVERAKERNPELELAAPDEVEAASQLVRRLDGIPLAIELAAARLGALDVLGLERKLSQGFPLVDESYRRPPRHRTIEATIEWSDRLLSESSRWLLRRLTIFSSPPDLQTLEEVCGKDLGPMVVDQLDELIDASLVSAWVDAAGTRRFRMLDAVASFAADRRAAEDLRDTRGRHADWAAALAAADGPLVHAEASCLERLSAAEHDLERAVAWLFEHRPDDGVSMATNLAVFWVVSGQAALGRRWLDRALEDSPADASIARAKLLEGAGIAASLDADYPRSDDMLVQAADMFSEIGRDGRSAYPRFWRARSTIVRGYQGVATVSELEAAHERLGRSLALMREHGDALGLVLSLPYEGWVRMLLGASEDPLEPLREAMALVDSPGLERVSAYAKAHMAHIVLVHGDDPDASDVLLSDAIAELRLARDRQNLLICLLLRAAIELRRGHVQPASVSVREAAAIAARGGTREWEPAVLALGWAVSAEGDALLACTLAGHLDATLPSWQVLLANTGVGPLLERLQSGLDTRDELVRRTAANAGRSQSAGHLVGLLARSGPVEA